MSNTNQNIYDVLVQELGTQEITVAKLRENFLSKAMPHFVVARIHLTFPQDATRNDNNLLTKAELAQMFANGGAICNYIDGHLAQEHPADKRFLLRYLEKLCLRHGINKQVSIGFGHDIIYSRDPIPMYKNFDNSLYVPPLTGHWAIVAKGAARD